MKTIKRVILVAALMASFLSVQVPARAEMPRGVKDARVEQQSSTGSILERILEWFASLGTGVTSMGCRVWGKQ